MSVTPVGTPTTGSVNGASSYTIAKPTGVAIGNLLLAIIANRGSTTSVTIPGFTSIANDSNGSLAGDSRLQFLTKTADGSEGSTFTVTGVGSSIRAHGAILAFDGHNGVDVFDIDGGSSATPTAPTVTPTVADGLLIFGVTYRNGSGISPPSGMSEVVDVFADGGGKLEVATEQLIGGPTATGTRSTNQGIIDTWAAGLIVIKPLVVSSFEGWGIQV